MKQNLGFFIALLIMIGLISIVPDVISGLLKKENTTFAFIVTIIGLILGLIVDLGLIKISLNFCDNLKSEIRDIFS